MKIIWRDRNVEEWRTYLLKVPRSNYLQSLPFARAVLESDKKQTRFAILVDDGKEIGMMAVHEFRFGPVRVVDLYRGPLWFEESPSVERLAAFAAAFKAEFPRRLLHFRRWLPEWPDGDSARRVLMELGFRGRAQSYETQFLDLSRTTSELMGSMRPNWRNQLRKSQRCEVKVTTDWKGTTAKLFLHKYDLDRRAKKYHGRSLKFMRSELSLALAYEDMCILWAVHEGKSVAAVLLLVHGNTASYRIGWTTDAGRECHAHNRLLWEAVQVLQQKGVRYFDLAGVEPASNEGLTHFKRGLGGEAFRTIGILG